MTRGHWTFVQSGLEEELDKAVSEGEFNEAVKLSDRLAQRDLATKVATAFDCYHYVQNSKVNKRHISTEHTAILLWLLGRRGEKTAQEAKAPLEVCRCGLSSIVLMCVLL